MKTLEQYIAERRRLDSLASKGPWDDLPASDDWRNNIVNNANFLRDARNEMPRVLDMLERQQKALDYIAQFESHDKGLNKILLKAREAKEDLERMVNE
ncbi:MAG: hypothetical protein BWZ03_00074 [bacterium ADurb.BinA186]|nr:MAG: hypothetical protein BWZ03_00074 [bacterium ADurb.BinA186]